VRATQSVALACALAQAGCAPAFVARQSAHVTGIWFSVDTTETPAPARGAFKTFVGTVEFAAGRGRLNVFALREGPALAVNGVAITAPLARSADYYLFDSTGFILVRPVSRTFSSFTLASSSYRHGDVREAGEGFFEFAPLRADTISDGESARLTQHGPVTIRWHLDRRRAAGPVSVLARGNIELPDAPAGEASVARWFGAAAALATMPDGIGALPPDSLQVTAAVFLTPSGVAGAKPISLVVLHGLSGVATAEINPARLVLPAGFTETAWPGVARVQQTSSPDAAGRWRTTPGAQRR
jgi:hypothetical protein